MVFNKKRFTPECSNLQLFRLSELQRSTLLILTLSTMVARTVFPTVALTMALTTALTTALSLFHLVAHSVLTTFLMVALTVFPMMVHTVLLAVSPAVALAVFPFVADAVSPFPKVPNAFPLAHAVLPLVLASEVFPLKAFVLTKSLTTPPQKKTLENSLVANLKVLPVTSDLSAVEDLDLTVASSDLVAVLTRITANSVNLSAFLVLERDSEASEISRTEQDASAQILTFRREVFAMVATANSVAMVSVALAPILKKLLANALAMPKALEAVVLLANVAVAPSELLEAILVLEAPRSLSVVSNVVALAVSVFDHLPFLISVAVDLPLSLSRRMLPTSLSLRKKSLSRRSLSRRKSLSKRRSLSRRSLSQRRSLSRRRSLSKRKKRKRKRRTRKKRQRK